MTTPVTPNGFIPFSGLEEAIFSNITGEAYFPFVDPNDLSQAETGSTLSATFALLRTEMFAGGAGFTAHDPLNVGPITATTGLFSGAVELDSTLKVGGLTYSFPGSQAANHYLKTDGAGNLTWASILETLALGDLSDVTITSPTIGQMLAFNGSGLWVNTSDGTMLALNASNLGAGTVPAARMVGGYTGITGLGTVGTGVWQGTQVANAYIASGLDVTKLTAGATLPSNVLASSLTSVGNLTSLSVAGVSTLTGGTAATLTFGTYLTGTSFNSSGPVTLATNATAANTVSTLVARDGSGNFAAGTITASITGSISGNAATATALQTARAINGVNFDGTAPITITAAAGTLTGATLAANVLASSLTSVGVLASPHFTSPVVDSGGLTVTAGGITVTGASTITGTLGGVTTLTATTLGGTLSTAAQGNVTSLGTLTGLTVSGTVSHTNANPFSMTNGQVVTVALTAQTVGVATLTIPNFASVSDTFAFVTLAQTLAAKTLSSPTLSGTVAGTPTWGSNQAITLSTAAQPNITSVGTLAANLLFVDATYDIGATGATRPRNIYASGTGTFGGVVTLATTDGALRIGANPPSAGVIRVDTVGSSQGWGLVADGTGGATQHAGIHVSAGATKNSFFQSTVATVVDWSFGSRGAVTSWVLAPTDQLGTGSDALIVTTAGALTVRAGVTSTSHIFSTTVGSTTSANAATYSATQATFFANTTYGAIVAGYGTTADAALFNRAGAVGLYIAANTQNLVAAGTLTGLTGVTTAAETITGVLNLSGVTQLHQISGHNFVQGDANTTYFYGGTSGGIQFRNAANGTTNVTITDSGAVTIIGAATIQTLTVGLGGGAVANNTAFGLTAMNATATGGNNAAFGKNALTALTSGTDNTALGSFAMIAITTTSQNTAIGSAAMQGSTGTANTGIGYAVLAGLTTGTNNVALGPGAGNAVATGGSNVFLGVSAGRATTGSGSVFLGFNAGQYETGSNAFYLDNQDRTNTAGDKAKALMYGTFNATAASQTLTINAGTVTTIGALAIAGALSGATTGAFSSTINGQTISATANFTGTLATANAITITSSASLPAFLQNQTSTASYSYSSWQESAVDKFYIIRYGSTHATRANKVDLVQVANANFSVFTNNAEVFTITGAGAATIVGGMQIKGLFSGGNLAIFGDHTASQYNDVLFDGASTANYGFNLIFQSAGTTFAQIGRAGRINGGSANDLWIGSLNSTTDVLFYTNNTLALTISHTSQVATFAGLITAGAGLTITSGQTLQVGATASVAIAVASTNKIAIKDATGTVYQLLCTT